ncbi:hypothetical protein Tco_1034050 [Tanacetum coccineum]
MIIADAKNRPPMLEKSMYDSWKSRMEIYMENRENGRMLLDSVQNGPLLWPTIVEENGLPPDMYAIANHHKVAKEIWDRVKLLMQGTKLSLQERECLVVPVFTQGDNPIVCLNKEMPFLPPFKTAWLLCNKFKGGKDKAMLVLAIREMLLVSGGNNARGRARVVKCYNYQVEGNITRQCNQPERLRNAAWFNDKAMLAEAQESGQILDEEQLAFLADLGILDGQDGQITITNTAAFQTEDLDAYDSNCNDVFNAKAVLMANLFNYGSDVILEVTHPESYHNDLDNQSVHAM